MADRVIARRYRMVERLGTGGMAEVWRAEDEVLGRSVAVKILHPQYAGEENFVARFRQEAQAAANLSHPNIVNIYDWGREEGTYFIVMEYLAGKALKQVLEERGNLRPDQAVDIARQVASALAYAHRNGVVHRDIKPHNIMLAPDGTVKVTDFGIARASGAQALTQTGFVMGTAQYLSPEQAQGKETGPATDVYSLGVVLYEMLTGNVPFDGESPVAVALKHVNEQPVSPRNLNPNVPPELERVVLRAMAKQPELRYSSADEMAEDLKRVSEGRALVVGAGSDDITRTLEPVSAAKTQVLPSGEAPASPGPRQRRAARRHNTWVWAFIVALLALASGVAAWALVAANLPKEVDVPNLVGMQAKEANSLLAKRKLRLVIAEQRNDDTAPAGQILSQDPAPGEQLSEGDSVKVVVSLGKAQVTVGSFIGLPLTEALRQIVNAGLVAGKITQQPSDTYTQDTVLEQKPKPGETVAKGTPVDLVVSSGKARVTVPDVKGMTKSAATAKLREYGLRAEFNEVFSDDPVGTVVDQRPDAGSEVTSGTPVTLDISKGPEMVTVPNVYHDSEEAATARLESLGFTVFAEESTTSDPTEVGKVVAQDPPAGHRARKGSQVKIYIGVAP